MPGGRCREPCRFGAGGLARLRAAAAGGSRPGIPRAGAGGHAAVIGNRLPSATRTICWRPGFSPSISTWQAWRPLVRQPLTGPIRGRNPWCAQQIVRVALGAVRSPGCVTAGACARMPGREPPCCCGAKATSPPAPNRQGSRQPAGRHCEPLAGLRLDPVWRNYRRPAASFSRTGRRTGEEHRRVPHGVADQ